MVNSNSTKPQKSALLVAQRIVRDIERQGLGPGEMLPPERSMMDEYAIGRGTLRESLRFLELQGVLRLRPGPGGGPVIQKPSADTLATTLALMLQLDGARHRVVAESRCALEPQVAHLAAQQIGAGPLAALLETLTVMEAGADDPAAHLDSDRDFHRIIGWASGNSLLGFLVEALTRFEAEPADQPLRRRRQVLKAHRLIYQALAAGDPVAASEAMREHLQDGLSYAAKKAPETLAQPITW